MKKTIARVGDVTIYLACKLYLPSGDVLRRYVVAVSDGRVLEWYPFESEVHSMLLVDELFVSQGEKGELLLGKVLF